MVRKKLGIMGTLVTVIVAATVLFGTFGCSNDGDSSSFYVEGSIDGVAYRSEGFVTAVSAAGVISIMAASSQIDLLDGKNTWTITANGTSAGTYNDVLSYVLYQIDSTNDYYVGSGTILTITITSISDVVEGTFEGQITYTGDSVYHTISGSFRAELQS